MSLLKLPSELLVNITKLCVLEATASLAQASRRLHDVASWIVWRQAVVDESYHRNLTVGAAESGNIEMLKAAAANGADLNRMHAVPTPPVVMERYAEWHEHAKWRSSFSFWGTPLHLAAYHGRYDTVRWLVGQGVDMEPPDRLFCDCKGIEDYKSGNACDPWNHPCWTPLHFAICRGHQSVARLLLSAGASVDTMPESFDISFERLAIPGFTGDLRRASEFIESTRSCSSRDVTALHTATQMGMKSLATQLVQRRRIDIDREDSQGWTPFFYAMLSSETDMIKHLVYLGAQQNLDNSANRPFITPLGFAIKHRIPHAIDELLKIGVSTWGAPAEARRKSVPSASVMRLMEDTHAEYQRSNGGDGAVIPKPMEELLQDTLLKSLLHPVSETAVLERLCSSVVRLDVPSVKPKWSWRTFGFVALREPTTELAKKYASTELLGNIRLLLRCGTDPASRTGDGDWSLLEDPLVSMLRVISHFFNNGEGLLPTSVVLKSMADVINEMGERGAWEHPDKSERRDLYSELNRIIGKTSDTPPYFRQQLEELLKVPHGWEGELKKYEAEAEAEPSEAERYEAEQEGGSEFDW
ncbi:ankyrin repeat domain protein [Colletotrichum musicola]|uniref:Ankyrin repeat domain protein n=1 Tax=Colletotrichum musicola TaxID=2175873 RepID=A0A8H6NTJ3_9PEZI|nr:ankyrin repeat domain protein [Colletotrichum musicola]